jgi:hypothetical protein
MQKMTLIPSVELSKLSYGQLGEDIIASFDIDDGHYALMVEKLYTSGLNVLPTNDKANQVLEFLRGKYGNKSFSKSAAPVASASSAPTAATINELKSTGKYDELLKITKMVNVDPDVKNGAKNAIEDTVKKSIDQNYNYALINKHAVQSSISNLIRIASDSNLKSLNMQAIQKQAGKAAIAICENFHLEHLDELIKISNNNQVPNIINLKSAAKFWEVVSKETEKYEGDIAIALKTLNVRFLENAFDVAQGELDIAEKTYFTEFREFIKSKKNL